MQPKPNISIPGEDENVSENVEPHKDEELILEEQDIKKDHRNLGGKSLNTGSCAKDGLSRQTSQTGLLEYKLSSSLREVRFSDQEFAAGIPISNIKYNNPKFQNNNFFYLFHDQLDYGLAKYSAESKITKSNVDKFLSELLMAPLIEKLSYQNVDK